MKNKLLNAGKFFKLVDVDSTLSLTNLAVWVVLVKLAVAKDAISSVDIVALVSTLLPYQAKKVIGKMKDHSK